MVDISRINPEDPNTIKQMLDRIAVLEKQLKALPDTLPPERGLAQATRQGYMSKDDKQKIDNATPAQVNSTIVMRDANGDVILRGVSTSQRTAYAGVLALGTFANNWTNEPTSPVAEYKRDVLGFVTLRGVVYRSTGAATLNEVIFTLPVGFRPTSTVELFPVSTNTGTGQVNVNSDGTVRWRVGGVGYLSLSGIRFEAVAL